MRRNFKLILGVLFLIVILLLLLALFYNDYVRKDSKPDFRSQSIEYWNNIMKECELDIDYIVKWVESNKRISNIYLGADGDVCYKRSDEILFDLDSRITEFVKKNDIGIVIPEEEDGNIIVFEHDFLYEKSNRAYELIYFKDEIAQDSSYYPVRDSYYKIKSNYYCGCILFDL